VPSDLEQYCKPDDMMVKPAGVSVIIPTACRTERAAAIRRAIESVLTQENVDLELIVIVNGPTYDRHLRHELEANPALRVAYLPEPNLPAAIRHGRSMVTRPFFAFLDDDDEYLPGALETRAAEMLAHPRVDVVATNGFWGPDKSPYIKHTDGVEVDPLKALLKGNWLGSCGGLFRSATVCQEYFRRTDTALRMDHARIPPRPDWSLGPVPRCPDLYNERFP
jgi:glycosyltransferase involved in cell wall biosynthesis